MNTPISLYLIGGFLGAGKTTFLQSLLSNLSDRKIGVLVNEFGAVGVDGVVLRQDGLELVELNRGSIFCSCLKQDFVKALKAFSELPIDALVIENSGMADPGGMQQILDELAPYLERPLSYHGLICLVDSSSILDYVDVLLPLQNQIKSADFILVNKTDLAAPETVSEIHETIAGLNPAAVVCDTVFATVPFDYLEANLSRRGQDTVTVCSCNTPENRPANYTLEADGKYPVVRLEAFCAALADQTLRIKGFLDGPDGLLHVDCVGRQISVHPADSTLELDLHRGKLVLIGRNNRDFRDEIEHAFEHHCRDICEIRAC